MTEDDLALEIARSAVSTVAPEELDAFEELATEGAAKDEDLALGIETVVVLVTPIAIAAAKAALTYLLGVVKDEGDKALRERIRAWLKGRSRPDTDRVRKAAFDKARAMGMEAPQAQTLADAVVGALASG